MNIYFSDKRILPRETWNTSFFTFPLHRNDSSFYKIRTFGYASDFQRFNNKEGIAFYVSSNSGGLLSYIQKSPHFTSTISDTCQNSSTFKIVKTFKLGNYNYVEAKFSANVYTEDEVEKKLTNGFIRFSY